MPRLMLFACIITNILAIALPSLRISPLLLIRIATIALLYAAALSFNVVYIQSIGSGIGIFSGLFHVTLISQSIETFFYLVGALILISWVLPNGPQLIIRIAIIALVCVATIILLNNYIQSIDLGKDVFRSVFNLQTLWGILPDSPILLFFFSVPIKPADGKKSSSALLSKEERAQFILSREKKDILIGLCLGDLNIQKQYANARLFFVQGAPNKFYLEHLYDLFGSYCRIEPKLAIGALDKRTGVRYSSIRFQTLSLPCFNEFFELFYTNGKKVIPSNIFDLLTPLGLAYWLADDGTRNKQCQYVELCTHSFTLTEVELLINTLNSKWSLKCYKSKRGDSYTIRIPAYSVPIIQDLLKDIMPSMMLYKIGL